VSAGAPENLTDASFARQPIRCQPVRWSDQIPGDHPTVTAHPPAPMDPPIRPPHHHPAGSVRPRWAEIGPPDRRYALGADGEAGCPPDNARGSAERRIYCVHAVCLAMLADVVSARWRQASPRTKIDLVCVFMPDVRLPGHVSAAGSDVLLRTEVRCYSPRCRARWRPAATMLCLSACRFVLAYLAEDVSDVWLGAVFPGVVTRPWDNGKLTTWGGARGGARRCSGHSRAGIIEPRAALYCVSLRSSRS
jgi:hypothetical protein